MSNSLNFSASALQWQGFFCHLINKEMCTSTVYETILSTDKQNMKVILLIYYDEFLLKDSAPGANRSDHVFLEY